MAETPVVLERLKSRFGPSIELMSEQGEQISFDIKMEFQLGGTVYVALQNAAMRKEDEVELFRVTGSEDEPELETIEDDEEWELASEAYDDMLFAGDETP
ncbi:DUF1292 domain-containing protein [Paenibacillus protaetiae]|uniref:DUF1292 domain-containing protein n=1 Tax=Paenibacillus protaetiae TaxID=2509456 RepID=A0A4P6F491_9BACL|nr:DUF1292 domain-containing protein [Paenibacillus protaetiae]QAY65208.1 DUF1292 domain-containing protein [Paenibacillus protaetiae]